MSTETDAEARKVVVFPTDDDRWGFELISTPITHHDDDDPTFGEPEVVRASEAPHYLSAADALGAGQAGEPIETGVEILDTPRSTTRSNTSPTVPS